MNTTLRGYQNVAVNHALEWFRTAKAGDRLLYAGPTGIGKSYIQLALLAALPNAFLVTPRQEILDGLLAKGGDPNRIATPIKLRNAMLRGEFDRDIQQLVFDEGHHLEANSWQQLELLAGRCPAIAYTATPYRGTPRSTAEFRSSWGEPTWIITYPEAVASGYISMPRILLHPLLDDDVLCVRNGEFEVAAVERETVSRLADAVELISSVWNAYRRPTMVSVPTTEIARQLHAALPAPSCLVTASTSPADRSAAFEACVASRAILVQINVVSEGVDLPIRRLVDLSPTLSPVRWLQQLGRITRPVDPGEPAPEYIGTNRNLLRHAYLLEGCLPRHALIDAQAAFPVPSSRTATRVLGLEAIGKLKPAPLPLADGLQGQLYAFSAVGGVKVQEYAVLLHPAKAAPIWAFRENHRGEQHTTYGRWRACDATGELTGYASLPNRPLTEKQEAWWKRAARRHGLDPDAKITRKNFVALPVLSDLRSRL